MSALDFLAAPEMRPFAFALGLVIGLVLLELAALALGASLMGDSADGPEVDLDLDLDLDGPDLDTPAIGAGDADIDGPELGDTAAPSGGPDGLSALLLWLGIGPAPLLIWIATFATGFGAIGYGVQAVSSGVTGVLLPAWAPTLLALPGGLWLAKAVATRIARALPSVQSSATRARDLGGRRGVVTGAEGRVGRPTEVRVTDRHGQTHYLRAEPVDAAGRLAPGQDVVVLARPKNGVFRAIALDDAA